MITIEALRPAQVSLCRAVFATLASATPGRQGRSGYQAQMHSVRAISSRPSIPEMSVPYSMRPAATACTTSAQDRPVASATMLMSSESTRKCALN